MSNVNSNTFGFEEKKALQSFRSRWIFAIIESMEANFEPHDVYIHLKLMLRARQNTNIQNIRSEMHEICTVSLLFSNCLKFCLW